MHRSQSHRPGLYGVHFLPGFVLRVSFLAYLDKVVADFLLSCLKLVLCRLKRVLNVSSVLPSII